MPTERSPVAALRPVPRASAALVDSFAESLAGRPPHTRAAYVRDAAALAAAAGDTSLAKLSARDLRRLMATLHGRGLSGRSLARMLASWRAFYRFLLERDPTLAENPCTGLRPPRSPRRLPKALSPDEAVRLVEIAGAEPLTLRD